MTELGISPHPSLVVGAEGPTEVKVLQRVFEQLGVPLEPEWIRIADFGGVDKDLTNLAKFAAAPVIGRTMAAMSSSTGRLPGSLSS
ncbi:MAG: hypothetical protein M3137_14065 [Actinomycetota bacterium]|nr:hypothetical protein [Actinomycetota bacterium]